MLRAFFCDAAATEQGKLHIHGIFNELVAEGFPARHDELLLCAVVEWPRGRSGRLGFTMDLLGPDGESVFTVEGHSDVHQTPDGRAPAHTNLILRLEQVGFPVAGRYRSRFVLDGERHFGPDLYLCERREPR